MNRTSWCVAHLFGAFLFTTVALAASDSDFGFLWISCVRAAPHEGEPQKLVGSVVIGIYPSTGNRRESFTIADETGYAMIPLRPGSYCAEAYGTNGRKLALDKNTNRGQPICFDITANNLAEAGLTISHDVDYKPDIPSKGVE